MPGSGYVVAGTGDQRMFDLVGPSGVVPVNGTPIKYTGSVGIRAYGQNGEWGVWRGNVTITITTP